MDRLLDTNSTEEELAEEFRGLMHQGRVKEAVKRMREDPKLAKNVFSLGNKNQALLRQAKRVAQEQQQYQEETIKKMTLNEKLAHNRAMMGFQAQKKKFDNGRDGDIDCICVNTNGKTVHKVVNLTTIDTAVYVLEERDGTISEYDKYDLRYTVISNTFFVVISICDPTYLKATGGAKNKTAMKLANLLATSKDTIIYKGEVYFMLLDGDSNPADITLQAFKKLVDEELNTSKEVIETCTRSVEIVA